MGPIPDARREVPSSPDEAGEAMRAAGTDGTPVRIRGGATKSSWGRPWRPGQGGRPSEPPEVHVSTERLDRVVEHNEGDLTAVLQAGAPLARIQETLADAGQMVALDPPLGDGGRVTATAPHAT